MSRSYEYSYAVEQARRQALYNERVAATTEYYYKRYMNQLEQMIAKGFHAYIPDEINRLKSDLSQVRDLIGTNPGEAKELSLEVGSYINAYESLAQTAMAEYDREQRIRVEKQREEEEKQKNKLLDVYYDTIKKITNPMVISFAQEELSRLKGEILSKNSLMAVNVLENKIAQIVNEAENHVKEWKTKTLLQQKRETSLKRIEEIESQLEKENLENKEKTDEIAQKITQLKDNVNAGSHNDEDIKNSIREIENSIDDEKLTEAVRRDIVISIVKELRNQEFIVEKPKIEKYGDENFVKILARKPSGKRAICKIDLRGKIAYKFDNYEGMTCLKDIEKFNVDLQNIYSVKLSDERVLWSNPNKLSKDSQTLPKGSRGVQNG